MARFRLRLTAPPMVDSTNGGFSEGSGHAGEATSSFYWLSDNRSSFATALTPSLGSLGPVHTLNIDLVRLAAAVYAADRSIPRSARGSDWNQRRFELEIPVSCAAAWTEVVADLEAVIGFLTGDRWKLNFNEEAGPADAVATKTTALKRVVLLSGGADSAIGALVSRLDLGADEEHALLSHFSLKTLAPIQRRVAEQLETLVPGPKQQHLQIHFTRKRRQLDGTKYPSEPSSRSRSLLFLALGLAVASIDGVPLWIPENGFASLNLPLGPERRGSLSTRTTHPAFLEGLSRVLLAVGAHGLIENPFSDRTKGEMFGLATELVGAPAAAQLLSATISCAHTGQRSYRISPSKACGVCFGCVLRRASFHAAGLVDATTYIRSGRNAKLTRWLDSVSVEPATRSFVARGVRERDVIALSLPPNRKLADALDLCRRGIAELADFVS